MNPDLPGEKKICYFLPHHSCCGLDSSSVPAIRRLLNKLSDGSAWSSQLGVDGTVSAARVSSCSGPVASEASGTNPAEPHMGSGLPRRVLSRAALWAPLAGVPLSFRMVSCWKPLGHWGAFTARGCQGGFEVSRESRDLMGSAFPEGGSARGLGGWVVRGKLLESSRREMTRAWLRQPWEGWRGQPCSREVSEDASVHLRQEVARAETEKGRGRRAGWEAFWSGVGRGWTTKM